MSVREEDWYNSERKRIRSIKDRMERAKGFANLTSSIEYQKENLVIQFGNVLDNLDCVKEAKSEKVEMFCWSNMMRVIIRFDLIYGLNKLKINRDSYFLFKNEFSLNGIIKIVNRDYITLYLSEQLR